MNEVVMDDLDETNITSLLNKWREIHTIIKDLSEKEESLKMKIKIFLKERQWTTYKDNSSGIGISIIKTETKRPDIEQLKLLLTEQQYSTVMRTQISEKMMITTAESREKMNKFMGSKTKKVK